MEANFWHDRWANRELGWHESKPNPLLVNNFGNLGLTPASRVFVPLCGKTLDIHWLLQQGFQVAGVELSRSAIEELFAELGVTPAVTASGSLTHFSAPGIDIFVGDIFALTSQQLGKIDAIYDRAALVALPQEMRNRYTAHLRAITQRAPQLLVCFVYDQSKMPGPPHSVNEGEVKQHYQGHYQVKLLQSTEVAGGLKGQCPATEEVWLLR